MSRLVLLAAMLALAASAAPAAPLDIVALARIWPTAFQVRGDKNEPTYLAAIDIVREGDLFTITGGAPAWAARSTEAIEVLPDGTLAHRICPKGMDCHAGDMPSGFLATAALLAALRKGKALGTASSQPYGTRSVVCVPADRLGIAEPVLDPCFDVATGAVLAQRHRLSGRFDGPSLDPWSIRIVAGKAAP